MRARPSSRCAKTPPNTRSPSSKDSPTQRTMFSNLWADGGGFGSARGVSLGSHETKTLKMIDTVARKTAPKTH